MNKKILTAVLALVLFPALLFAQSYEWAKRIGTGFAEYNYGVAVDKLGNVYVTGSFDGTPDFDPGAGGAALVSNGYQDIYLAKYDENGNYLWAFNIGGSINNDIGEGIAIDNNGNVYITGSFEGVADFDPGPGSAILTANGGIDIFFAKYSSSGNFILAKNIGSATLDYGRSIAVDDSQNIYIAGMFEGTADFDPGTGTNLLTAYSSRDIFFARYDALGNHVWAHSIGTAALNKFDYAFGITTDHLNSSIYLTGTFNWSVLPSAGTADFDPGPDTANITSNGIWSDAFVARYSADSGNYMWAFSIAGVSPDYGEGVTADSNGNLYVTGEFQHTADFDPGTGVANLSTGIYFLCPYIASYDSSGNYRWADVLVSGIDSYGIGIAVDESIQNVYVTGYFNTSIDFDPGPGIVNINSVGNNDIFFADYNAMNGNYVWANTIGSTDDDRGYAIAINDSLSSLYVSGEFRSTADFDPGSGIANLTSAGQMDFFFGKYSYCSLSSSTLNISVCNTYTSPSGNYTWTTSGTYMDTIPNAAGCDSVITINLSINNSSSTQTIAACNTYTSPSGNYTWTTSSTYMDTIPNAAGCDSVFTINLTINTVTAAFTLYPDTSQAHNWFAIANVTGTPPYTYIWSWGDGNTSTGATPSHTYAAPAFYAICLSVTDGSGCTTTYCDSSTYISKTEEAMTMITINVVTQLPNGIATVTAAANSMSVTPNPCITCELTGATNATDLTITDILGRKQNASFSKSASGYYINLPVTASGIFLIRNMKTGEVVKFVKE